MYLERRGLLYTFHTATTYYYRGFYLLDLRVRINTRQATKILLD